MDASAPGRKVLPPAVMSVVLLGAGLALGAGLRVVAPVVIDAVERAVRAAPGAPGLASGGDGAPGAAVLGNAAAGVAAYFREVYGLEAAPEDVVLPEGAGAGGWLDPLRPRTVAVVARPLSGPAGAADGSPPEPDIFLARARFGRDGRPLAVAPPTNVTRTPDARETLLAHRGSRAAYALEVFGQLRSILVVDFAKDSPPRDGGAGGWLERLRTMMDNLQETGQRKGIGLTLYTLGQPAACAAADFEDAAPPAGSGLRLSVELAFDRSRCGGASIVAPGDGKSFTADVTTGAVTGGDGRGLVQFTPRVRARKPLIHWMVDAVRNLSFVGPRKIALLEKWVFNAQDAFHRLAYRLGIGPSDDLDVELQGEAVTEARRGRGGTPVPGSGGEGASGPSAAAGGGSSPPPAAAASGPDPAPAPDWPPPPIRPAVANPKPGEGTWVPFVLPPDGSPGGTPDEPPAFYRTSVRMEPEREFSSILLVAMDMRRLDLHMVGGTQTPTSSTGFQGNGRIPRDPDLIRRVVAAFNGGFQTAHGAFGMMTDRQVILPPMPRMATVVTYDDGSVEMGTWNNTMAIPRAIRSFRQNLPPLVADGVFNPTRKKRWGGTVSDLDQTHTARSALCIRPPHTLVYAWGKETSAEAIGAALNAAGCTFGLHLDMNPYHTGFYLLSLDPDSMDPKDGKIGRARSLVASAKMEFDVDRFIQRNGKDFFFLTRRPDLTTGLGALPPGFGPWEVRRPPPGAGFLPLAAVARSRNGDAVIAALDAGRCAGHLKVGTAEVDPLAPVRGGASPDREHARREEAVGGTETGGWGGPLVAVLDLGTVNPSRGEGLVAGGFIRAPLSPTLGTLVVRPGGRLALEPPAEAGAAAAGGRGASPADGEERPLPDGRQGLPLLFPVAPEAILTSGTHGVGDGPHQAVAMDAAGRLLWAHVAGGKGGIARLADLLQAAGARSAILLPAGRDTEGRLLLAEGASGRLLDLVAGTSVEFRPGEPWPTTRLFLAALPEASRVRRLVLPDVEMSEAERREQERVAERIRAMREVLRAEANAQYEEYITEVRSRRKAAMEAANRHGTSPPGDSPGKAASVSP